MGGDAADGRHLDRHARDRMPAFLKRALDIAVAATGLLLFMPLFVIVAVAIKLDSPGPVLFTQDRIGRGMRRFGILKFRTMRVHTGPTQARISVGNDPRITRIGRFLRRTKIDELPQLLNVLKGDMSLVGPRPELEEYVRLFRRDYDEILKDFRPGMTDLASMRYRNEAAMLGTSLDPAETYVRDILPEKIRLSKQYVRCQSFIFDMYIVLETVFETLWREVFIAGRRIVKYRRPFIVVFNLGLVVLTSYSALWLRFDGRVPRLEGHLWLEMLPWLLITRGLLFAVFGLYEGLWRYTSIWDLRNIINGVMTSEIALFLVVRQVNALGSYPRSCFVVDGLLLIVVMGASRLAWRFFHELTPAKREKTVLVVGAGASGEALVRLMRQDIYCNLQPIGFVDDDVTKVGQRIHGLPIMGTRADLPAIIARRKPDEVMIALPDADPSLARSIVHDLESFKVAIKIVPNLRQFLDGKAQGKAHIDIRDLSIEDLLSRPPVGLDRRSVKELISKRRVLVTGAGGSIGSELCRQLADLGPSVLILYERYENGLYSIATELEDRKIATRVVPVIGDVTDAKRLNAVMVEHAPHIVFHAAAHKHVPLMEFNACEAVKNNVLGTRIVAEMAQAHGVERFVLISTDKAVKPTSVMGATKRVAEMLIEHMAMASGRTALVAVRFGNVLGSSGSVVPRFVSQIRAGGPVTVTDPEMQRYFMLISEAVQLVLHAAALGNRSGIFVLEMGERVKLTQLARDLIRLAGLVPEQDIEITYTGLRPGEKLYEELANLGEVLEPTAVDKIFAILRRRPVPHTNLLGEVAALEDAAVRGSSADVIRCLKAIVPSFSPDEMHLRIPEQAVLPARPAALPRPDTRSSQGHHHGFIAPGPQP